MLEDLDELVELGYITKRRHPEENLYILNYTPKTQYEGAWGETTSLCRGLIVDVNNSIKARCFRKFFNYEECADSVRERLGRNLNFSVSEKMDGSLGILYWVRGKPFVATRGSFESEQALRATKILERYDQGGLDRDLTYLFEIIYPENRVCVDYGDREELVLLSVFETSSGKEVRPDHPFPAAETHDLGIDFEEMKRLNLHNREGFVVRFEDGYRFKIKFEDYVRLHNVIFSISTKSIWESLRQNRDVPLDLIPDEVYRWVSDVKNDLLLRHQMIEKECLEMFRLIESLSRRDFASKALQYRYSSVLFKMLDGRPYADIIWKILEPEYRTPRHEKIQEG